MPPYLLLAQKKYSEEKTICKKSPDIFSLFLIPVRSWFDPCAFSTFQSHFQYVLLATLSCLY